MAQTAQVCVVGNLDSQPYISQMLRSVVVPYLLGLRNASVQYDDADLYFPRLVLSYLDTKGIQLLPCLARSADPSPTKNS
ncbi:hypothetical protein TNCV_3964771 [Trichonephila clavipes]|nr:hypothetical protein TNCV_3964771 [Trichonephila clavipes]